MTAADLVPWFQMASTVIAGIGIVVSVYIGVSSLNNNRIDRIARIKPDLLFNIGGQEVSATLHPITFIPGLTQDDPEVSAFLGKLPKDLKGISLNGWYGQLFNHGSGPALSVYVWFEPNIFTTERNSRHLKWAEKNFAPYSKDWNWIAATPATLAEGEAAFFGILPVSVFAASPDVRAISGAMHVECRDRDGRTHQWAQPATFFIDRSEETASITVSFGQRPLHLY